MDLEPKANPYTPPASELNQGLPLGVSAELAERGTRLVAVSLDGLLICLPLVPVVVLGMFEVFRVQSEARESLAGFDERMPMLPQGPTFLWASCIVLGLLAMLGVCIYQWILITRTGQTLGKKWTGIRIERLDGRPVTFGSCVVVRNWVPKVMGSVPYLGLIFHLVDSFFIFREDRRCLHDHIAGTRVVRHR
jgi:uncharacterized RDD family membrane protein YckC